ncbi:hypothetical protein J6590_035622 [Homalodisca vitripennis]|nr:hypothetical protein J6590_035622 [Homalodisca vitripennis]
MRVLRTIVQLPKLLASSSLPLSPPPPRPPLATPTTTVKAPARSSLFEPEEFLDDEALPPGPTFLFEGVFEEYDVGWFSDKDDYDEDFLASLGLRIGRNKFYVRAGAVFDQFIGHLTQEIPCGDLVLTLSVYIEDTVRAVVQDLAF